VKNKAAGKSGGRQTLTIEGALAKLRAEGTVVMTLNCGYLNCCKTFEFY